MGKPLNIQKYKPSTCPQFNPLISREQNCQRTVEKFQLQQPGQHSSFEYWR